MTKHRILVALAMILSAISAYSKHALGAEASSSAKRSEAPEVMKSPGSSLVYASLAGAALDSDLSKGGGTDDTHALQLVLDRAKSGRAVHLIVDGPALIAGLDVHSNTTIECTAGGGFYLKDYTNRAIVRNANRSRGDVKDENIVIRGCFINGNRANQHVVGPLNSVWRVAQEPDGTFRSGLQFFGVKYLTIEDVIISDSFSFGIWVANAKFIRVAGVTVRREFTPYPEEEDTARIRMWYKENGEGTEKWSGNDDAMHFNGPIQYLTIDGVMLYTWDDGISLAANEYDTDDITKSNVMGPYVGQGPITDVAISNVTFMGSHHGIRMLSGNQRLDRVVVNNVAGTIRQRFAVISPFIIPSRGNFGSIAFNNINLRLTKHPAWAALRPEKGWQKALDEHYADLAARKKPKNDFGEEMEIPLFSLNGRIEALNLSKIAVDVDGPGRPLIRVGHTSSIQIMSVDMTVLNSAVGTIPLKLMGRIERLRMALNWAGEKPIEYRGGGIGQLHGVAAGCGDPVNAWSGTNRSGEIFNHIDRRRDRSLRDAP